MDGKFTCNGLGSDREARESTQNAFNYLKANGNRISQSISTTTKDYIIQYQDLQGIGMTSTLSLPTLIALCSIAILKPTVSSLAVLGDISVSGTVSKVENLANTLQVCLDSDAKKVLLPITSAVDLESVPSELVGCFNLIFFNNAEDAVFCSECGYKIQENEEKIIVESEDNEIKPPKIIECEIYKDSNIKENESKKSHDNIKIKFDWPFDKTKTIIVVVIAIVLVLFISVIISNNAKDEYDGSGTISSVNDDDDYDYDDEMTESEIKSSIEDSTMEANDTFNAYYDGDTPTIDFKIQNDTDYYIYSADVDIKIGNHVYSKTVRGISPDSYEEVSIGLDFVPDDESTLTYSFTVTDISYD